MSSHDRVLFALAHAGLTVGPGRPVDTARFVALLADHGFGIAPSRPEELGSVIEAAMRAGYDRAPAFDVRAALETLEAGHAVIALLDDLPEVDEPSQGMTP